MARLLLTILAAALVLPASAGAHDGRTRHPHPPGVTRGQSTARRTAAAELAARDPVVLATAVAKRYWGAMPCNGQVTVLADVPFPSSLEPTTDGWVTFNSALGANNLEAPAGTYSDCVISLAHWQWSTRSEMVSDWNMFCLTVIHEMGHLLGHPHSLIPGSVMAPVFANEASVPSICRVTRPSSAGVAARSLAH